MGVLLLSWDATIEEYVTLRAATDWIARGGRLFATDITFQAGPDVASVGPGTLGTSVGLSATPGMALEDHLAVIVIPAVTRVTLGVPTPTLVMGAATVTPAVTRLALGVPTPDISISATLRIRRVRVQPQYGVTLLDVCDGL